MSKTILFLNLRRTAHEAYAALMAVRQIECDAILISDKPYELAKPLVKFLEVVDTYDHDKVIEKVQLINQQVKIDGIVTWADRDVELVARLNEMLGLRGPSRQAAYSARNKHAMLETLAPLSDLLPRYKKITDKKCLKHAVAQVGFPAVMKPTSASGSKGIFVVHSEQEALEAFKKLQAITSPDKDPIFKFYGNEILFEEYLDGNEFSVEGWVYDSEITIVGITDKLTTDPFHLEFQHIYPSNMSFDKQDTIRSNVYKIVKQLQLNNCAFHLEAKWTSQGFKFIEIAARSGGDYITSHLIPMATNLNFYVQIIKIILGKAPEKDIPLFQYAGVRFLLAQTEGTFYGLNQVENLLDNPMIRSVFLELKSGQSVSLPPSNFATQRGAAVIASYVDYQTVAQNLENAAKYTQMIVNKV
jgi:biotin carboxylase